MEILNKKLVDNAANEAVSDLTESNYSKFEVRDGFKYGVQFAESQLKELAMRFAMYYYGQIHENSDGDAEYWFNEFIKD